jgi:transcriptional regulator with XRE-family HTH domain
MARDASYRRASKQRDALDDAKAEFAANLQDAIARSGRTYYDIATGMGVRESTFQRWVAGSVTPQLDRLRDLADTLGVTVDSLLARRDAGTGVADRPAREALEGLPAVPATPQRGHGERRTSRDRREAG